MTGKVCKRGAVKQQQRTSIPVEDLLRHRWSSHAIHCTSLSAWHGLKWRTSDWNKSQHGNQLQHHVESSLAEVEWSFALCRRALEYNQCTHLPTLLCLELTFHVYFMLCTFSLSLSLSINYVNASDHMRAWPWWHDMMLGSLFLIITTGHKRFGNMNSLSWCLILILNESSI